jgi:hypothetical protein
MATETILNTTQTCADCKAGLAINEKVRKYVTKAGTKYYCLKQHKNPSFKATAPEPATGRKIVPQAGGPSATSLPPTNPAEGDVSKAVEERLAKAKGILKTQCPDAQSYAEYYVLLAEICHQLFAKTMSMRIQQNKLSNIREVAK